MKTTEGLNTLKNEVEAVSKKLAELTEDELAQLIGGGFPSPEIPVPEPRKHDRPIHKPAPMPGL